MIALVATALGADFATLMADSGWENVSNPNNKVAGPITIDLKPLSGTPCLRAKMQIDVDPDTLYAVVTDMPGAKAFSSSKLIASRELGRSGKTVDYYQHLDVPNWTMAADRFWVLRGEDVSSGEVKSFRWDRFDWRTAYPALVTELETNHGNAVEPDPNYGAWVFTPKGSGTAATYFICNDPGASLPYWVKKAAATKTLPTTMADVVREARRRAQ